MDRITQVYIVRLLNLTYMEPEGEKILEESTQNITFQAVARFISHHISDISLEQLEHEFHFQRDYYSRLIKKYTGFTYAEYVKAMRMDKAKNLLTNTDISVKEIMSYLGYHSHDSFYQCFQKETGMSPLSYREAHRK